MDKLVLTNNLKKYLYENGIPVYRVSLDVLNKSPSYLGYKLKNNTLRTNEIKKILDHLNINESDLLNEKFCK
ncbi:hypothetical protein [Bartonella australis]|uniref:hypothetical protein n=1 Tax=Bartonella australis TaxID=388640 RepID=UPI000347A266|nr:hypothetical protein [Bartonella australis]